MTNRKHIHLYIIITCLILAIGAAMGTVFHFLGNGFFNYGVENTSGSSISVTYYVIDYTQSEVEDICTSAFESAGLSGYKLKTSEGDGYLEYVFGSADTSALSSAVSSINNSLAGANEGHSINIAAYHVYENEVTNLNYYIWGSIVAAIAIGVQAVYVAIRYKLNMAAVSILSNAHSIMLLAAILAITRIPFGSYAVAIMALCLLMNMICQQLFFVRVKAALKDAESPLSADEKVEEEAKANYKVVSWLCLAMIIVCAVYAIAMVISSFSLSAIAPALAGICGCLVCWYTSAAFIPALYACVAKRSADRKAAKANKNS